MNGESSIPEYRRPSFRRQSSNSSNSSSANRNSSFKRPRRGCLQQLAQSIMSGPNKKVVIVTGAGLSVASGVRPFRGTNGIWSNVIWQKSTREAFRDHALEWYNDFWLPHFHTASIDQARPNAGHEALQELQLMCENVRIITQNIDGLHGKGDRIIEAHGRLGWYKCVPAYDSDTDSDSDEDDDRLVHLGHRRKSRARTRLYRETALAQPSQRSTMTGPPPSETRPSRWNSSPESKISSSRGRLHHVPCRYEILDSIPVDQLEPPSVREILRDTTCTTKLTTPPRCPSCHSPCLPQALLFDEGYHSHAHYDFERMEQWLEECNVLVFVGTSFAVRLTQVALEHARSVPGAMEVYNFNTSHVLEPTARLNVTNIVGTAQETLPKLLEACRELHKTQHM